MTDTNGNVAAAHLTTFNGVPVSRVIYPMLVATAAAFARSGFTFSLYVPAGGMRNTAMQNAIQVEYDAGHYNRAPYWLAAPPSPRPADVGKSRHGFGLAVDVVTNAPLSSRNALMTSNGWTQWTASDHDHFEPTGMNVLVSPPDSAFAGGNVTPLPASTQEDHMLVIDGGLTANRKAIALAGGPGGWHIFSGAEWNLFYLQHNIPALQSIPTVQPVNDAGWDMFASIFAPVSQQVTTDLSSVLAAVTAAVTAIEAHDDTDQQAVLAAIHSAVLTNPNQPTDLTPVLSAIAALSASDAGYVQQVEAILAKGLTITGTAVPK